MPIAALDSGGAPAPVVEAVQSNPMRLAYRSAAYRKRKPGHPRPLRRWGFVLALILLILVLV